ncbi:BMP family protein [Oscillospiraceae bacterium PP1C4]
MKSFRKTIALILALTMSVGMLTACGASSAPAPASEAGTQSSKADAKKETKKIAMICDPVGTNPFLTQIVDKLEEMKKSGEYPIEYSVIECADTTAWSENVRASVEENYDMIMAVGYACADPLKEVATQFPDKAQYVCIDTVCDSPNVKSYIFKPEEGAFLIGAVAALVSADLGAPKGPFGGVHVNPGPGSFEWRYGYMQGARTVNPEIQLDDFVFNYTKSFTDAPLAKELALQQAAKGCKFINAAAAVADFGTFEAAKEKGFYTSGQDSDRTDPNNEFIITTQVKYTGIVAENAVKEMFETGINPGVVTLGLADGVVGATYITDDGINPRNPVLTDAIVEQVRGYADQIRSGKIVLTVPAEEEYK